MPKNQQVNNDADQKAWAAARTFFANNPSARYYGHQVDKVTRVPQQVFVKSKSMNSKQQLLIGYKPAEDLLASVSGGGSVYRAQYQPLAGGESQSCIMKNIIGSRIEDSLDATSKEIATCHDLRLQLAGELDQDYQGESSVADIYLPMPDLGQTLSSYLKENPNLSFEKRCQLAIKICQKVEEFHMGLASSTGVCYMHGDINPGNITIDAQGEVHLIDVDCVREGPEKNATNDGTPLFIPEDRASYSGQGADIFGILRVLALPEGNDRHDYIKLGGRCLFTPEEVEAHPKLAVLVDLDNMTKERLPKTAREVAATVMLLPHEKHADEKHADEKQLQSFKQYVQGDQPQAVAATRRCAWKAMGKVAGANEPLLAAAKGTIAIGLASVQKRLGSSQKGYAIKQLSDDLIRCGDRQEAARILLQSVRILSSTKYVGRTQIFSNGVSRNETESYDRGAKVHLVKAAEILDVEADLYNVLSSDFKGNDQVKRAKDYYRSNSISCNEGNEGLEDAVKGRYLHCYRRM